MARQEIDLTTPQPNGKMGEPTKSAWEKVNDMTQELYAGLDKSMQFSGKNILHNCGIPVNQRGFQGGALAFGAFGYDRWKGGNGGCTISINSSGVWSLNGAIQQVIDDVQDVWNRPITFSAQSPSGPISVYMGGATGVIPAGSGRQSVTLQANGSGNMLVDISTPITATFSMLQMERGTSATSFDFRPISLERAICERYAISGNILVRGNGVGVGQWLVRHSMRAIPTITVSSVNYLYSCSNLVTSGAATYAEFYVNTTNSWAFACNYILSADI